MEGMLYSVRCESSSFQNYFMLHNPAPFFPFFKGVGVVLNQYHIVIDMR